jgi:hypothetical protein
LRPKITGDFGNYRSWNRGIAAGADIFSPHKLERGKGKGKPIIEFVSRLRLENADDIF